MRLAIVALAALLAVQPVFAKTPSQTDNDTPNESQLVEHGSYRNSDGQEVHSPAHSKTGKAPAGASAKCRDGTYSFSTHRRGTCSHHGGVAAWL
ncbi:hypothetical protein CXB49_02025 [Chromobacterium sp. ATCC 53434]|uniref:DUF3761 domain-containing protein n=1 Tax=Chromobacterium TaxID=535 RepID=UPI000C76763A|nr:DUF3761 domain-containing protein [Chromobacterium sp. ATCC 53434]AUH49694.1 hypothetical protein CXB49_02025 [Chromobacterium sp. ATCC 53434]